MDIQAIMYQTGTAMSPAPELAQILFTPLPAVVLVGEVGEEWRGVGGHALHRLHGARMSWCRHPGPGCAAGTRPGTRVLRSADGNHDATRAGDAATEPGGGRAHPVVGGTMAEHPNLDRGAAARPNAHPAAASRKHGNRPAWVQLLALAALCGGVHSLIRITL
jgi:hypothetical protein